MHLGICLRRKVPADRPGRRSRFSTDGELILQELLLTVVIHYQKNDVLFGSTDLKPNAATLNSNGSGGGPTCHALWSAAHRETPAILGADDKACLFQQIGR